MPTRRFPPPWSVLRNSRALSKRTRRDRPPSHDRSRLVTVARRRSCYDDQFIKLRRTLGIIAEAKASQHDAPVAAPITGGSGWSPKESHDPGKIGSSLSNSQRSGSSRKRPYRHRPYRHQCRPHRLRSRREDDSSPNLPSRRPNRGLRYREDDSNPNLPQPVAPTAAAASTGRRMKGRWNATLRRIARR